MVILLFISFAPFRFLISFLIFFSLSPLLSFTHTLVLSHSVSLSFHSHLLFLFDNSLLLSCSLPALFFFSLSSRHFSFLFSSSVFVTLAFALPLALTTLLCT
ncbi:MAG: hypothetical protein J3R72DRAFT_196464 [Linnemannia gamsii]|nr:MAG: hypothetical protein J3R72DRAFT_196464 [Linnemannia gamsii]